MLNYILNYPNSQETIAKLEQIKRTFILSLLSPIQQENWKKIASILKDYRYKTVITASKFIGYPTGLDCSTLLKVIRASIVQFPLNIYTNKTVNDDRLIQIEKNVIEFFAERHGLSSKHAWGYVNSGGTESNNWAILQARHKFSNSTVYFTNDTHYSVSKITSHYKIPFEIVKSCSDGSMDFNDLIHKIKNHTCDSPPIIISTLGTTMLGGIDDINKLNIILEENDINEYYIHCDGAIMAEMLPEFSKFNRSKFDSLSSSTHKWLGSSRIGSILICNTSRNPERIPPITLRRDGKLILELALKLTAGGET